MSFFVVVFLFGCLIIQRKFDEIWGTDGYHHWILTFSHVIAHPLEHSDSVATYFSERMDPLNVIYYVQRAFMRFILEDVHSCQFLIAHKQNCNTILAGH